MRFETLELVRLTGQDVERHGHAISEWILDAGHPHLEWLYMGDRAHARRMIASALASDRSELWIGHLTALVDSGRPVGGFLALPGHELPYRRKADLAALIRSTARDSRDELRRRVEVGKDLYPAVEPAHRFLSKFGLLPAYRGRGLGGQLLDAFIARSWDEGYSHIRLDVARTNTQALRLYEDRGFEAVGARVLEPLNVEYVAMVRARENHG